MVVAAGWVFTMYTRRAEPYSEQPVLATGWVTVDVDGRVVTWHNGGTGGFRTWLGLDRAAGTGAVIMSATSASVDRHGFALLLRPSRPRAA